MQTCNDLACDARPFKNKARVNLQKRRARRDFFPRVIRSENSAHTDDWQLAARALENMADDFRAARLQRLSAQAAWFGINFS